MNKRATDSFMRVHNKVFGIRLIMTAGLSSHRPRHLNISLSLICAYPVVSADPNMLRSTKANLHVLRAPNPLVGCRCAPGPEAKQRLSGRHGVPQTVVPEHEP